MRRREYIALTGLIGLVGCSDSGDSPEEEDNGTDDNADEPAQNTSENTTIDENTDKGDTEENNTSNNDAEDGEEENEAEDDAPEPDSEAADRIDTSRENIARAYDAYVRQGDGKALTSVTTADNFSRADVRDRMSATLTHLEVAQEEGTDIQATTASRLTDVAEWLLAAADLQRYLFEAARAFGGAIDVLERGDYTQMRDDWTTVRDWIDDANGVDGATALLSEVTVAECEALDQSEVNAKAEQFENDLEAFDTIDDWAQGMRTVAHDVSEARDFADDNWYGRAEETLTDPIRVLDDTDHEIRDFEYDPLADEIRQFRDAVRDAHRELEDERDEYQNQDR